MRTLPKIWDYNIENSTHNSDPLNLVCHLTRNRFFTDFDNYDKHYHAAYLLSNTT